MSYVQSLLQAGLDYRELCASSSLLRVVVAAALNERSAELSRVACALLELWASNPRQHRSLDPASSSFDSKGNNKMSGSVLHLLARVPLVDEGVTRVCVAVLETLLALHRDGRFDMHELACALDADQKTALELLDPDAKDDPRSELLKSLAQSPKIQVVISYTVLVQYTRILYSRVKTRCPLNSDSNCFTNN